MTTCSLEKLARVRRLAACGEARKRRQAADLSLSEIAKEVGVTHGTVWKWETGKLRPNGPAALKYLSLLEKLAGYPQAAA